MVRRLALVAGAVVAVGMVPTGPALVAQGEGSVLYAGASDAVPGQFVVVLHRTDGVRSAVAGVAAAYGAKVGFTYTTALHGFSGAMSEAQARKLAADPRVAYVAADRTVTAAGLAVQPSPPSWGLDRVDQRSLPLDLKYHYPSTAPTARAYVIDTGIRYTHQEFGGRAVLGIDTHGGDGSDCNGHGTHMAGTIGGRTTGIAKQVKLVSVRVLNCAGSGTFAQVLAGVDWVALDNVLNPRPSVANMSLGGGVYQPLDDAVTAAIDANVHFSVAAGGSNTSACNFSPARTPRATTVAASTTTDARASFTNYGPCVDLFAPGMTITSAWITSDAAYQTISGTSPSTAHAAGAAALWRHRFPADTADQVASALTANATPGVVTGIPATPPTPNLLLFTGMIPA